MKLECQNCHTLLDIVTEETVVEVKCPSCGSQVDLSSAQVTVTYVPPTLGTLAHFELLEHIGRGHFGDVFKAKDSRLARLVAVKVPRTEDLDEGERETFFREARTAARLRHPNIVTVYDVGEAGETMFIASELIDGVNLADLISKGKLAPRRAAEIAARIADALHHAHDQQVIHRDLKPRNVMLDAEDQPHLLDFGLAKQSAGEYTITAEGDILGTPAYMAPEQARGQSHTADRRTDVYAAGVTLYEMLTGRRPFRGEVRGLIFQILHEEPAAPRTLAPEIPRDLETVCLKAMAKRPEDRYATAADLAADLRRYLSGMPIKARRAGPIERAWRWCRRNPAIAASGALAATAIAAAIGMAAVGRAPVFDAPMTAIYQEPPDPRFRHKVLIDTIPPGANFVCYPLDFFTGRPQFDSAVRPTNLTPAEVELGSGMYLVVAYSDDAFHEVLRSVPKVLNAQTGPFNHEYTTWDKEHQHLVWKPVRLFPRELAEEELIPCPGCDKLEVDWSALGEPSQVYRVPPFLIEPTEVSVAKYERLAVSLRYQGRAKNLPAGTMNWGQAVAYAESRGLRLPDVVEMECLTTAGGTQKFPWGENLPPADNWSTDRPVDGPTHDHLTTNPRIVGLHSGLLEWTATRTKLGYGTDGPGLRYLVRGGSQKLIASPLLVNDAGPWASVNEYVWQPIMGVRCARSSQPRLEVDDFIQPAP
jgi:formylglycine-generating enzyme required for sulfatase activity